VDVIETGSGKLGDLEATTLEIGRSPNAVNVDPDCPADMKPCVGLFSFPQWDGEFYSQGGPFHLRLVAVDAVWGGETHGLYAMIEAADDKVFGDFAPGAATLIEGARLPRGVGQESVATRMGSPEAGYLSGSGRSILP
jgi:hypothetical protein